jgi:hypothetical protein
MNKQSLKNRFKVGTALKLEKYEEYETLNGERVYRSPDRDFLGRTFKIESVDSRDLVLSDDFMTITIPTPQEYEVKTVGPNILVQEGINLIGTKITFYFFESHEYIDLVKSFVDLSQPTDT